MEQALRELARVRKLLANRTEYIDSLREAAMNTLDPIEEAMNVLNRHDEEVPGLNGAHADLRAAIE